MNRFTSGYSVIVGYRGPSIKYTNSTDNAVQYVTVHNVAPPLVNTSTELVNVSTKPVNTSTKPVNTSTKPVNTSTKPVNTSTELVNTSTKPVNTSTELVNTSTKPLQSDMILHNNASKSNKDVKVSDKKLYLAIKKINTYVERPFAYTHPGMAICISFYDAIGYKRPLMNILYVINELRKQHLPIFVMECCIQDKPPVLKHVEGIKYFGVQSNSIIFSHKERMLNELVIRRIPKYKYVACLDGDVLFSSTDWYNNTIKKFETTDTDLLQPFDKCSWLDPTLDIKNIEVTKEAWAKRAKDVEDRDVFKSYHPGFVWCFNTDFFHKINGFFDLCIDGSGDTAIASMCKHFEKSVRGFFYLNRMNTENSWLIDTFKNYINDNDMQNFKFGYLEDMTLYHMWHGDRPNREYYEKFLYIWKYAIHNNNLISINNTNMFELCDNTLQSYIIKQFRTRAEDNDIFRSKEQ